MGDKPKTERNALPKKKKKKKKIAIVNKEVEEEKEEEKEEEEEDHNRILEKVRRARCIWSHRMAQHDHVP